MKRVIFYLTIIFAFFVSFNVKALEACTNEELARLKELASNVNFNYSYELKEVEDEMDTVLNVNYTLEILNDNTDLSYTYKINSDNSINDVEFGSKTITGFQDGDKVQITIKAHTPNLCSGKTLVTKTINLPYYNDYYYFEKEKCSKYPEFKYCKELMATYNVTQDEFDYELDQYIAKINGDSNVIDEIKNINPIVLTLIVVLTLIAAFIIVFTIIKKRKKEDDDL